jgi:chalcone synthase
MAPMMLSVLDVMRLQCAEGPATVLAIGTATPANYVYQADYPDYFFQVTRSEHLPDLKQKFKKICKLMGKEKIVVFLLMRTILLRMLS